MADLINFRRVKNKKFAEASGSSYGARLQTFIAVIDITLIEKIGHYYTQCEYVYYYSL